MNLRKASMKYDRYIVFIRHDSAEIWGFRHGLTRVIGTLKIMASTGDFLRVICFLKRCIKSFHCSSCMILNLIKH
jgi:hypothetical protein